jgi:hypothetical protein
VPLPLPLLPEVTVIQLKVVVAPHGHVVEFAVTFTLPFPPLAGTDALNDDSE